MKALLKRRHVYAHQHTQRRLRRRITSLGISFTILLAVSFAAAGIANAKKHAALTRSLDAKTSAAVSQSVHARTTKKAASRPTASSTPATSTPVSQAATLPPAAACTTKSINAALSSSSNNQLQSLTDFDAALCAATISSSIIYTDMPQSNDEADKLAATMSQALDNFAAAKISPIVIVEPKDGTDKLDLANLQTSTTGSVFEYYLSALKTKGVTDAAAGTWVLFPEPNIPKWSTVDPAVFTANFSTFGTLFREFFKTAPLSVLLDSTSYASNDYSGAGSYSSLLPYVSGLPTGLVNRVGYEGFPWVPPATSTDASILDAADFLKPSLLNEVTASLAVQDVWLDTGTFASYYTAKSSDKVTMTATQRSKVLDTILTQAKNLQKGGLTVNVTLFAKDQSDGSQMVDWSYWPDNHAKGSDGATVIGMFTDKLASAGIQLGIY